VNASIVVDVQGLGQDACPDVHGLAILGVLERSMSIIVHLL
jgi:hypothetical protein